MSLIKQFENKDRPGTYDGAAALAALTGLSRDEIAWTAKRIQWLMKNGTPKDEAVAITKRESKERRDSGVGFT